MRVLVTGASGFVGTHLVVHLEAHGDVVVPSDRIHGGVDITDPDATRSLVADARPEVVYHLAGYAHVGTSWDEPLVTFQANAEGTLNVLSACDDAGVDRVLLIGSADVYGRVTEQQLPLDEETPLRPVSPYAASKVAAEFLGLQAHLGGGLGVIRVRAFNHLGPGQSETFVASAIASRIAHNEIAGHDVVPVGNLSPRRDFTDVRDVVRAYRLLVVDGEPGEVYNVCSGRDVAVRELAERLVAMASTSMRLETDSSLVRPVDIPVLRGDPSRLHAATGWKPEIPLDQTLADVLDECRRRVRGEREGAS